MNIKGSDDLTDLSLEEVCSKCGFTSVTVTSYIQEGLIDFKGDDVSLWRFTEHHLVILQSVYRLENDLRLNPAGAVLAHELMVEIESLKKKLQRLSFDE